MAFTTPNFKIDSSLLTFQPVQVEVEEIEGETVVTSNGGRLFFGKESGRIFKVTYGRGRMTPEGALDELRTARNSLAIHTVEYNDETGLVGPVTVIWPGDPPHTVVAPGHIGKFTFELFEVA